MNVKSLGRKILWACLPGALYSLCEAARAELIMLRGKYIYGKWALPARRRDECVIVANGPSVAEHQAELTAFAEKRDVISLNFSPVTPLFHKLRPWLHVMADPLFFGMPHDDRRYGDFLNLYKALNELDYEMQLYVPHEYYAYARGHIDNRNVTLRSFSTWGLTDYNRLADFRLRRGLASFACQTVTIAALYLALVAEYKRVWIIGFDLSDSFSIDENCNVVTDAKHFYDAETIVDTRSYYKHYLKPNAKLHEELRLVKAYAEAHAVPVINLSLKSSVDAFPKGTFAGKVFPYKVDPRKQQPTRGRE